MRRDGAQQQQQCLQFIRADAALLVKIIDQAHHRRDGGVELHPFKVLGHLFDGAVDCYLNVPAQALRLLVQHLLQAPYAVKETAAAAGTVGVPRNWLVKCPHEHLVHAEGVGTDLIDHVVGVDHVAARFAHLFAVLTQDHAVAGTLLVRLRRFHHTDIVQEQMPEAAVQKVQRGVFHATVVPVNRHPVIKRLPGSKLLIVMRVAVAQEIPAGPRPLGHGVCFPPGGRAAARAGHIDPVIDQCQRALTRIGHFILIHFRQQQGQV